MHLAAGMVALRKHSPTTVYPMPIDTILLPCPYCKKGTAPAFMWHLNETEWMLSLIHI